VRSVKALPGPIGTPVNSTPTTSFPLGQVAKTEMTIGCAAVILQSPR
jgi:hypothetical protein